ncbi:MAG: universal stress protein [Roseiarcus sp.]|jgi:nucleotide-binding universal stress UspA family protein
MRETPSQLRGIEPFHVFSGEPDQLENTRADHDRRVKRHAALTLAEAQARAEALRVPREFLELESDRPYQSIIDAASQRGCDLIAMASHGRRGVAALLLGSEALKVLTHSSVTVLVYR